MDQSGAGVQDLRAHGRGHECQSQEQEQRQVAFAGVDSTPECGGSRAQECADQLLRKGVEDEQPGQLDRQSYPDGRNATGDGVDRGRLPRHGVLRQARIADLSGAVRSGPELLSMGGANSPRQADRERSQASSIGPLDRASGQCRAAARLSNEAGTDDFGLAPQEWVGSECTNDSGNFQPRRAHRHLDGDDQGVASGGGGTQSRTVPGTSTQEGQGPGHRDRRERTYDGGDHDVPAVLHGDYSGTEAALDDDGDLGTLECGLSQNESGESTKLSASQKLSQQLSLPQAKSLESRAWRVVPGLFQDLIGCGRMRLLEVGCSPDSPLTEAVQAATSDPRAADRIAGWNGGEYSTDKGIRKVLQVLEDSQPTHVWMSLPGAAFSSLQNANQSSDEQRSKLQKCREQAMREYVGACVIFHACVQRGAHVTIELPDRCHAWRLPLFQQLQTKYDLFQAVAKGCRIGLRSSSDGLLLNTGWKLLTTQKRLAESLNLPCHCPRHAKHGRCLSNDVQGYPREFTRRATEAILQELDFTTVVQECQGASVLPRNFGEGSCCACSEVSLPQKPQKCAVCLGQAGPEATYHTTWSPQAPDLSSEIPELVGEKLTEPLPEACYQQEEREGIEALARQSRVNKDYQHETCDQLLNMFKTRDVHGTEAMSSQKFERSHYVVLGAYSHGNHYGITSKTEKFPEATRYLLDYMKHWNGESPVATTLVVNLNRRCQLHRDLHNDKAFPNCLIGVSKFEGGRLWVENLEPTANGNNQNQSRKVLPTGEEKQGTFHEVCREVTRFSPKAWHGPEAWKGVRNTVCTYVSRGHPFLTSEDKGKLQRLGFRLPRLRATCEETCLAGEGLPASSSGPRAESKRQARIKRQLYLLHAATGHGSVRSLVDTLKRRNASAEVLELARNFKCSICQERSRVKPRHLSSLEALPPKWHTVSADIGHWRHPRTHEHVQFMVVIDEGSRFRVAKVLSKGSKQQPNTATCLQYFREAWGQYFGMPRTLRVDPAGALRSQGIVEFCDREHIFLDNVPADAHWQIGVCEQAVQGLKSVLNKLCEDDPELSPETALTMAVTVFNHRDQVRGFSPVQHALGRAPDVTGRFIDVPQSVPDDSIIENASIEFQQSARLRAEAEKAHAEWNARQRVSRALNSRTRQVADFHPGDLVYFWRSQESGQSRTQPGSKQGRFLGPARVLAMESRQADGTIKPGGIVWCVRGRQLIKCCVEQLRLASEREELLDTLASTQGEEPTPWTFTRLAEELGGNQYQDYSHDKPAEEEWLRAQDIEQEVPPVRYRLRRKRAAPETTEDANWDEEDDPTPSAPSRPARHRPATSTPQGYADKAECWYQTVREESWSSFDSTYWRDPHAAVEVGIDLPEPGRAWNKATQNLRSYFVGAMKRQAVEVSEKRLTPDEREAFRQAKMVEVRNFIAAGAFETLPSHLRPTREQAIGMRWVLTWKTRDDGSRKPKARAVLLGYQDPCYEHRATTAPVMTRQSRQYLLQIAAVHNWHVFKGDVSGAFLQGRDYPGELFCVPCPEICQQMGLPEGTITKLRKACYGLVDAPLEWYKTVSDFLAELGLERLWSDACTWVWRPEGRVRAVVSGHVDDFLFTGGQEDQGWQSIVQKIKDRFQWGDWDKDDFVQCGVRVQKTANGGFSLSQPQYVEAIPEIPVNSSRRKQLNEPTTGWEKTQLRALLGALSWHAQQVAPHASAPVGLLLSETNHSTVATLIQANTLLRRVKEQKDHQLLIHPFPSEVELGLFAWVDAASQNRRDGGSTQGIMIGLAPLSLLQGEVCPVTPVAWHSHRIDRVCRSPGAAETLAAVNGEDELYYARFQWAELMFGHVNTKDPTSTVRRVSGCVVTDSRNVYDKLQTEVMSIKGAEKRANIELLSVKQAQQDTQVQIRWVHSEAQLSNSLTKANGYHELDMFYKMGHRWRIVEDDQMRSARRRKVAGMDPLQQTTTAAAELQQSKQEESPYYLADWVGCKCEAPDFSFVSAYM